jgi:hypothetical protein
MRVYCLKMTASDIRLGFPKLKSTKIVKIYTYIWQSYNRLHSIYIYMCVCVCVFIFQTY